MKQTNLIWVTGFTLFALFFGAGNITFPLFLGAHANEYVYTVIFAFILSGVLLPLFGLITILLQEGNYFAIFRFISKPISLVILTFIVMLLGPFIAAPRCVSLIVSLNTGYFPILAKTNFIANFFIFFFAYYLVVNRSKLVHTIGKILAPIKLGVLLAVIIFGLWTAQQLPTTPHFSMEEFKYGLTSGYNTMDLLAAIFFANMIYQHLKTQFNKYDITDKKQQIKIIFKSSFICSSLLAIIYAAFALLAAGHASALADASMGNILEVLSRNVLGLFGSILVCAAISIACFITAVALVTISSDFLAHTILKEKVNYKICTGVISLLSYFVSILGFDQIVRFSVPVLKIIYPGIILLMLLNILYSLIKRKSKKAALITATY